MVARTCLERLGGWRVLTASSGREALEVVAEQRPDAIVLDVMMPEMDGPTTLRTLRAAPETASIPVVFLSAKAQAADRAELASLGAEGVLTKPFDPVTLADEIAAVLGWS